MFSGIPPTCHCPRTLCLWVAMINSISNHSVNCAIFTGEKQRKNCYFQAFSSTSTRTRARRVLNYKPSVLITYDMIYLPQHYITSLWQHGSFRCESARPVVHSAYSHSNQAGGPAPAGPVFFHRKAVLSHAVLTPSLHFLQACKRKVCTRSVLPKNWPGPATKPASAPWCNSRLLSLACI